MPGLKEYTNQKLLFPVSFVSFCEGKKMLNCCPHAVSSGKTERSVYFLSRTGFAWWIRLWELWPCFMGLCRSWTGGQMWVSLNIWYQTWHQVWRLIWNEIFFHEDCRNLSLEGISRPGEPLPRAENLFLKRNAGTWAVSEPAHRLFDRSLFGRLPQKRPLNRDILNSPKLFVSVMTK